MAIRARLNRILLAGLAALTMLTTPLASYAKEPTTVDVQAAATASNGWTIALPITQTFATNMPETGETVNYSLTALDATEDSGYWTDTPSALTAGTVTVKRNETDDTNVTTFTINGSTTQHLTFSATTPGLYLFRLTCTSDDDEDRHYYYDHTTYTIRYYVRSSNDAFITAQRGDDKVAEITYYPRRWKDGSGRDQDDDNNPVTPTNPTTPNTIEESGSDGTTPTTPGTPGTEIGEITESGDEGMNTPNNAGPSTGDESNMTLYAIVVILGIIGLAVWIRRQHHT